MITPNPVVDAVTNFYNIHPFLTVFLGIVFFPEIEIVVALLALFFAAQTGLK